MEICRKILIRAIQISIFFAFVVIGAEGFALRFSSIQSLVCFLLSMSGTKKKVISDLNFRSLIGFIVSPAHVSHSLNKITLRLLLGEI